MGDGGHDGGALFQGLAQSVAHGVQRPGRFLRLARAADEGRRTTVPPRRLGQPLERRGQPSRPPQSQGQQDSGGDQEGQTHAQALRRQPRRRRRHDHPTAVRLTHRRLEGGEAHPRRQGHARQQGLQPLGRRARRDGPARRTSLGRQRPHPHLGHRRVQQDRQTGLGHQSLSLARGLERRRGDHATTPARLRFPAQGRLRLGQRHPRGRRGGKGQGDDEADAQTQQDARDGEARRQGSDRQRADAHRRTAARKR